MARKPLSSAHSFENRVVWITGASSGIGEALALRFARENACLVLSARREAELQRVADQCIQAGLAKDKVMVATLDITDLDAITRVTEAVMTRFGQVDLLINNAGMSQRSLCKDTDLSVYRKLLDVDVMGQIALTKAVLPHMLERREGHIAVTASVAGKVGARQRTGYCAAKHAVMGFFDSLRAEVEDEGVQVSTIVPGFINTPLSYNALAADGSRFDKQDDNIAGGMDVTECADVIAEALAKGKREIPVGKGKEMAALWMKRAAPELVFKMVKKL